jgi:MFS superfamily sulfate permease-like transporter/CRP-like cAMP-binding protein
LIADGGFELGAGHNMKELVAGITTLPAMTYVHTATAVLAAGIMVMLGKVIHSGIRLPIGLLLVTLITHGVSRVAGYSMDDLHAHGFLLEGLTAEPWTSGWVNLGQRFIDLNFSLFLEHQVISLASSYLVLHIITFPFYGVAVKEVDKTAAGKQLDMKKEIMMMSGANVVVGALGGVPTSHSIKVLVVMQDGGAKSKFWSLLVGLTLSVFYFVADVRVLLSFVPRCAFGGLVASLGFEFIDVSVAEARERIGGAELRLVLITAVVTWFDVLTGLGFGLCLVMVFFVVEYAGMTGISRHGSLQNFRSNVDRSKEDRVVLDRYGERAGAFWLTGYIFFGSAVGVVEEVEAFIENNPTTHHLIIDFEHVPAVDASAVHHFTDFASKCQNREPPIEVCFCGTVRRLRIALSNAAKSKKTHGLKLDAHLAEDAIYWAEESLLQRYGKNFRKSMKDAASPLVISSQTTVETAEEGLNLFFRYLVNQQHVEVHDATIERLKPVVTLETLSKGHEVFAEGSRAEHLIFLLQGSVAQMRKLTADDGCKMPRHHLNADKGDIFVFEERTSVRVHQASAQIVLGATEYITAVGAGKSSWTTTALAMEDCQIMRVPFDELAASLNEQPTMGFAVVQRLGFITSSHLARLLRKSEVMPFSTQ